MRAAAMTTAIALALAGCAALGTHHAPVTAEARGLVVARSACAGCHAVEAGATSPQARAPGFASREMQHTAGLEGRVGDLTRLGHYGMPPLRLSPSQVDDVVAYIESLARRDDARRPPES